MSAADYSGALEAIAKTLPNLPAAALDSSLLAFDALVALSSAEHRAAAAQFLRDAAAQCRDRECADRIERAADDVAAARWCARTPDGLTGQQAAAAQTMTMAELQARPDLQDETLMGASEAVQEHVAAEELPEEEEPPSIAEFEAIWDHVEDCLCAAEDRDEDNELLEAIREDVEEAKAWLSSEDGDRGPAPGYTTEKQVAAYFGAESQMAHWMRRLFDGMKGYLDD